MEENKLINHIEKEKKELLHIKNLSISLKHSNKLILKLDDFKLYESEFFLIYGQSGVGKTTLMEILLINQSDIFNINGQFFLNGILCKNYNSFFNKLHKLNLGYIFQDYNSFFSKDISIESYFKFFYKKKYHKSYQEYLLFREFLIKILNLNNNVLKKNAFSLSGGEKQRVLIILVLVNKPKFVFLDEVFSGLDVEVELNIIQIMLEFIKLFNMTFCLISHKNEIAKHLVTRKIELNDENIKNK